MTRRVAFQQADITRALKAAKAAGVEVRVIVLAVGDIVIEPFAADVDADR